MRNLFIAFRATIRLLVAFLIPSPRQLILFSILGGLVGVLLAMLIAMPLDEQMRLADVARFTTILAVRGATSAFVAYIAFGILVAIYTLILWKLGWLEYLNWHFTFHRKRPFVRIRFNNDTSPREA